MPGPSYEGLKTRLISKRQSEDGLKCQKARKKAGDEVMVNFVTPHSSNLYFVHRSRNTYASDCCTAKNIAKCLTVQSETRGLAMRFQTLDSLPLSDLTQKLYVMFVSTTAVKGELPQNAHVQGTHWMPPMGLKYAVFGMGESHDWTTAQQ